MLLVWFVLLELGMRCGLVLWLYLLILWLIVLLWLYGMFILPLWQGCPVSLTFAFAFSSLALICMWLCAVIFVIPRICHFGRIMWRKGWLVLGIPMLHYIACWGAMGRLW